MDLQDAKNLWEAKINSEGGRCPCCNRFGKKYKRGINGTMARSLVWLSHHSEGHDNWVDVPRSAPRWLVQSNQLASVRWWGLATRSPSDDPDKKHSGLWRATPSGTEWAHGRIRLSQFVWTYDGEPIRFEGPLVTIFDVLGTPFSYDDIMRDPFA
jgi:hypothetical protein